MSLVIICDPSVSRANKVASFIVSEETFLDCSLHNLRIIYCEPISSILSPSYCKRNVSATSPVTLLLKKKPQN